MMSSDGNIFRVTVPFCGESTGHRHFKGPCYCPFVRESTGHRWIPLTKGQYHGPLKNLCCQSEQNVEQTLD